MQKQLSLFILIIFIFSAGCDNIDLYNYAKNPPPDPEIDYIAITPDAPTITMGSTQQLTATVYYIDGSPEDITSEASWSSDNAGVATVSATGLAEGVTSGNAIITAVYSGVYDDTSVSVP